MRVLSILRYPTMTTSQKHAIRRSEIVSRLNEVAGLDAAAVTDEVRAESEGLRGELATVETQFRAAVTAEEAAIEAGSAGADTADGEAAEFRALMGRVSVRAYVENALGNFRSTERRSLNLTAGAELEFNQAVDLPADQFPLRLLAPPPVEVRATTGADIQTTPKRWIDRLFADTAAEHIGIMMESVAAGKASFPITTSPATVTGHQRGKEEVEAPGAWTIGAVDFDPSRMSIHFRFAGEDSMRVPGLEDALVRDMRMALRERMDYVVFQGDDGATPNAGDIDGLFDIAGLTEQTLTQANKVLWPQTLAAFTALIDGLHAEDLADVRIVTSVGATRLWRQTSANTNRNESLAQVFMANGLNWKTRAGIATTTAANDFLAAVGLMRGNMGAGVCPVWQGAELIRDKYSGAASGQVQLTLNAFWNFGLVRSSNFARVKLS